MELVGLVVEVVFGDEFDFSDLVARSALGGSKDGEEAPVGLVDGLFQAGFEVAFAGVGVVGGDEVVDESEKVGAVARAHQLHGRRGFRAAEVEGFATGGVGFAAFAGAQGHLSGPCLSIGWWIHGAECGWIHGNPETFHSE